MSRKPKVVAMVVCPDPKCGKASHALLKLGDRPKIKVISCVWCGGQMEVGYEAAVNVEVAAMRHLRHQEAHSGRALLDEARRLASQKEAEQPRVTQHSPDLGAVWHRSALFLNGDDNV
jgi:hypothetical protein